MLCHVFFQHAYCETKSQAWAPAILFGSATKMTLSLQSDPSEVAAFVQSHGLSPEGFLKAKITGATLLEFSGNDMVSGGLC